MIESGRLLPLFVYIYFFKKIISKINLKKATLT